jgi:hypothetical protein
MASLLTSLSAPRAAARPESDEIKDPNRERLGVRAGYVASPSGLEDSFGGGLDLSLHWAQRLRYPLSADVTMGAFYLGATTRDDITIPVFGQTFDKVSMRVIHVTVAAMLETSISDRTHVFASAGTGLYTVSLLVDQALSEYDLSNNHWGVNLGGGFIRQISGSWFLDLTGKLHKFWTSNEPDDWFFVYSEGDEDPLFYSIDLGFMLRL